MYDDGKTMSEIAEDFNSKGLRNTRGTKFNINAISKILRNRRYIGEYKYRDISIPDGIPAIVPKDLFERIQKQMQKNKKAPASAPTPTRAEQKTHLKYSTERRKAQ